MTLLDLRSIKVRVGEEDVSEHELAIEPVVLGGQEYAAEPATVPAELRVNRATSGTVYRLRFHAALHGPCFRCLEAAAVARDLDLREYQDDDPRGEEELTNPYIAGGKLDLGGWARDALVLSLPDKILCREDCAGLCPVCGGNLNEEPHAHEEREVDSRWAALAELRDEL